VEVQVHALYSTPRDLALYVRSRTPGEEEVVFIRSLAPEVTSSER
jgi:hypothetical protein